MSGVIAWLTGFLDGSTGKYTFRSTTFRSDTFASGCWTGVRDVTTPQVGPYILLQGPSGKRILLQGPAVSHIALEGPDLSRIVLRG